MRFIFYTWNRFLTSITKCIAMENEKKIKEPYRPEDTPNPPQIIDPNRRNDEPGEKNPVRGEKNGPSNEQKETESAPAENGKKEKLLGESETEITDETTI
jgi:hypothetical protein